MPKATFSQQYITIYVYEKDQLIPKLCVTRTINLSNTQFRYQLVFFAHIYGWHLLPRQNLLLASFALAKHARWYVLTGGMILLIQREG